MRSLDPRAVAERMRSQGYTFVQIAAALDIPEPTIYSWSNRKPDGPGVRPGYKLKKSLISREEIMARCERGESCRAIAKIAGISRQAISTLLGGKLEEIQVARKTARDIAARQTARHFRECYRAALLAAGWKRCGCCDEWRDPETHGRCIRCRFCNNENSRRNRARANGLAFIPNDPATWWTQYETGEKRKKVFRRGQRAGADSPRK